MDEIYKKELTIKGVLLQPIKEGERAKILERDGYRDTSPVVAITSEGYYRICFETEYSVYTLLIDHDMLKNDRKRIAEYKKLLEVS